MKRRTCSSVDEQVLFAVIKEDNVPSGEFITDNILFSVIDAQKGKNKFYCLSQQCLKMTSHHISIILCCIMIFVVRGSRLVVHSSSVSVTDENRPTSSCFEADSETPPESTQ